MNITDVRLLLELFGYLVRPLGALIFGLAAGWLTVRAFKMEEMGWQLPLASLLGVLAAFVLLGYWVEGGGTLGMFGLGAGAAVLIWGLAGSRKPQDEDDED
ncbi:MAG: hypothetical protein AB1449_04570 [Chloroflexota bacterium]